MKKGLEPRLKSPKTDKIIIGALGVCFVGVLTIGSCMALNHKYASEYKPIPNTQRLDYERGWIDMPDPNRKNKEYR